MSQPPASRRALHPRRPEAAVAPADPHPPGGIRRVAARISALVAAAHSARVPF